MERKPIMLVLSRKERQRIRFPHLDISIEIVRIAGNTVRVGIDAPDDVKVLREEIADSGAQTPNNEASQRRHELRNRLHTANLALRLMQKQLDAGRKYEAERTLCLALDEFAALEQFVTSTVTRSTGTVTPDLRKRRALLVEDNAHERELLAGYLRLSGYEVNTAEDGQAAMEFLAAHERPDVVLLDMQMPGMDGRSTVTAIRCNPAYHGLKVFAVSGADRQSLELGGSARDVDGWFAKPLDPAAFVGELDRECSLAT